MRRRRIETGRVGFRLAAAAGGAERASGASNYQTNPHPQRHSDKVAYRHRLEKLSIVRTLPHAQGRTYGGRAGFGNNCRRAERPLNLCDEDAAEACCDDAQEFACWPGPIQNKF
jgi:hypothetical protein